MRPRGAALLLLALAVFSIYGKYVYPLRFSTSSLLFLPRRFLLVLFSDSSCNAE
jgi:hypothetical protein